MKINFFFKKNILNIYKKKLLDIYIFIDLKYKYTKNSKKLIQFYFVEYVTYFFTIIPKQIHLNIISQIEMYIKLNKIRNNFALVNHAYMIVLIRDYIQRLIILSKQNSFAKP